MPDEHEQIISTIMKAMITTPAQMPMIISRLECFLSPPSLLGIGKLSIAGGEVVGDIISAGAGKHK